MIGIELNVHLPLNSNLSKINHKNYLHLIISYHCNLSYISLIYISELKAIDTKETRRIIKLFDFVCCPSPLGSVELVGPC